jgi:virginiamycin B lyase
VTLSKSSDLSNVVLHYDGMSSPGYALSATIAAPKFNGGGGAGATLLVTTLALSSASSEYTSGALALKGNGDVLTLNIGESNAPSTPTYAVTPAGCDAIAEPLGLTQSSGSGSVAVFARGVRSASGCTIAVSDGTSTLNVAVSNTYGGVEGTPAITYFSAGGISPTAMTVGPDANIWFAGVASIGSIAATGTSPTSHTYALPTNSNTLTNVNGLTTGPDGNLWYAGNAMTLPQMLVGSFSPSSHAGTNYAATFGAFPFGIVPGPDGNLWFAQLREPTGQNAIGKVTTGGTFTDFPLTSTPYFQTVSNIVSGPDGNLWFTENCEGNLGSITTAGTITEYPAAGASGTVGITVGPDGLLWYTNGFNDYGWMTTGGTAAFGQAGLTGGSPRSITTGPDGAIWFVEAGADGMGNYYIGRVNPSDDSQTEISLGKTAPTGPIIAGPDGALWFASGSNVGRIALQTSSAVRRHHARRPEPRASVTAR